MYIYFGFLFMYSKLLKIWRWTRKISYSSQQAVSLVLFLISIYTYIYYRVPLFLPSISLVHKFYQY